MCIRERPVGDIWISTIVLHQIAVPSLLLSPLDSSPFCILSSLLFTRLPLSWDLSVNTLHLEKSPNRKKFKKTWSGLCWSQSQPAVALFEYSNVRQVPTREAEAHNKTTYQTSVEKIT